MDKRKVIVAYRRGFITIQECAQILGIESIQIKGMMSDPQYADIPMVIHKHSANG